MLKIKIGDKEYTQNKLTGRILRKVLLFIDKWDDKITQLQILDMSTELIVDAFDNKFSCDDVLDNLDGIEISEMAKMISVRAMGKTDEKLDELGKN